MEKKAGREREGEEIKGGGFRALKIACAQDRKLRNRSQRFRNQFHVSGEEKAGDGAREEAGVESGRAFSRIKKFELPTEDSGALPGFTQRGKAPGYAVQGALAEEKQDRGVQHGGGSSCPGDR